MASDNYWQKALSARLTRRRSLAAAGAATASAAFLAACGGSSSGGGSSSSSSSSSASASPGSSPAAGNNGLLAKREDTSKQAKMGGVLKMDNPADPPHFDPQLLTLPAAAATSFIFNKLMAVKPGSLQISDGTIVGDMAQSFEFSPDKLTLTMKIRPDAGTPPNQAPLNGRKLDSSDVVFSWNRWAATGTNRADLVNSVNPAAPVLSLTATDPSTVVIKIKEPIASILAGFSSQLQGQFFILPKEADGGFDVRRNPIGAGTYYMSEYTPSANIVYTKNPNSYNKVAYPDRIETPIISENAQVIAQLQTGNIYTHYAAISTDSVLQLKKDQPAIGLYQTDIANIGVTAFFGQKATPPAASPFRDLRVRQAFSMAMDRDLYLDTFANVSKFKQSGLPVDTGWNSALAPSDYKGWWLDPQSKDFGPNSVNYVHNIADAKKLMSAAGIPDGATINSHEIGTTDYGPLYARQIEVIEGMAADLGFKFNKVIHGYATDWVTDVRDAKGFFDGIAYRLTPIPAEPGDALYATYNNSGSFYTGWDPDGKGVATKDGPFPGDPMCNDLTSKIRTEFDNAKRIGYAQDLQRYLGKQQYYHRALGSASSFNVAWPVIRNFSVFNGLSWGYLWQNYWIDDTQAPLKKS